MERISFRSSKEEVQRAATTRNIAFKTGTTKAALRRQILEYDLQRELPIFRIRDKVRNFRKGDIVLRFENGTGVGNAFVKDYEGNTERVPNDQLERVEVAWGLGVDPNALKDVLDHMVAEEEKSRPASKTKTVSKSPAKATSTAAPKRNAKKRSAPGDDDDEEAGPPSKVAKKASRPVVRRKK